MLEHNWIYPEAPIENVFGSHPNYDEACGLNDHDDQIPVDDLPSDSNVFDELADDNNAIELDDESVTDEHIRIALQLYTETVLDWWTALSMPPVVETKVSLKEFDRRARRWRKVSTRLPIVV